MKTFDECCKEIAKQQGWNNLVTGHKRTYFEAAAELYATQWKYLPDEAAEQANDVIVKLMGQAQMLQGLIKAQKELLQLMEDPGYPIEKQRLRATITALETKLGIDKQQKDPDYYKVDEKRDGNNIELADVCLHEWDEGNRGVHKCIRCGEYNC